MPPRRRLRRTPKRTPKKRRPRRIAPKSQPTFGAIARKAKSKTLAQRRRLPTTRDPFAGKSGEGLPITSGKSRSLKGPDAGIIRMLREQGAFRREEPVSLGGLSLGGSGVAAAPEPEQIKPVTEVVWKEGNFNLETPSGGSTPSWWKPLIPSDSKDMERPDVAYAAMLNMMIPYMSGEDQRRAAGDIYGLLGGAHFGKYQEVSGGGGGVPITQLQKSLGAEGQVIDTQYFQSRQRATGAINALSQLREQTVGGNREKIGGTGQGYRWLQKALEQILTYGGGPSRKKPGAAKGGQTRAQYLALQGALDPIMAQAKSLGPVGSIGQMLLQPFFSQGGVRPTQRTQSGRVLFGQPNPLLFG